MPVTAADVLWGFLVPALVAAAVLLVLRRLLPSDLAGRYPGAIALSAGFFSGFALLALAPWQPSAHWHWLPYLLLGASLVGPVVLAGGTWAIERWLMYALVATVVSWILVPDWEDLAPPWGTSLIILAASLTLLAGLLEPLAARLPGPILAAVLSLTGIVAAVMIALSGNLRMAQIAGAGAGALTGCAMASRTRPERSSLPGMALSFAVLVGGFLFAARVNSFAGLSDFCYLLPPLAPLGLWGCVLGRRSEPHRSADAPDLATEGGRSPVEAARVEGRRVEGRRVEGLGARGLTAGRLVLGMLLVLLPLAVAVGLAVAAELGGGDEWQ